MEFQEISCKEFVEVLSSKAPTPGGGGASALVGAIAVALGHMVGSLTVGKKRYAEVEAEIADCNARAHELEEELLGLVGKDAEAFLPLAAAYRMPEATKEERAAKEAVMEEALKRACAVPLRIMEVCASALDLIGIYADKGSVLALSDAGAAAACIRAAIESASLNVYINTKSMKDAAYAAEVNKRCDGILAVCPDKAQRILTDIYGKMRA